jgi:hypothetical protein
MSKSDVEKGSRGLHEITGVLEGIKVGIVCLAPDNLTSPWIHFESGALSKIIDEKTRLCTYLLCGLRPEDVGPPLSMFQHTTAEKEETRQLVRTINRTVNEEPIPDPTLDATFEALWPNLCAKLQTLPQPGERSSPKRSAQEMVAEILELTRAAASSRKESQWIDRYTPMLKELFPLLEQIITASKRAGAPQSAQSVGRTSGPPQVVSKDG